MPVKYTGHLLHRPTEVVVDHHMAGQRPADPFLFEAVLDDRRATLAKDLEAALVSLREHDHVSVVTEHRRGGEPDVARADDRDAAYARLRHR